MQPDFQQSKNTHTRSALQRTTYGAGLGMLLSFAGCMASAADGEQFEPGQTSSERGGSGVTGAAGASASPVILPATAGGPTLIPETASCATDADCRVEQDNCSQCACQALGATQGGAACYGEKVTCVLDSCANAVARCVLGHCKAETLDDR